MSKTPFGLSITDNDKAGLKVEMHLNYNITREVKQAWTITLLLLLPVMWGFYEKNVVCRDLMKQAYLGRNPVDISYSCYFLLEDVQCIPLENSVLQECIGAYFHDETKSFNVTIAVPANVNNPFVLGTYFKSKIEVCGPKWSSDGEFLCDTSKITENFYCVQDAHLTQLIFGIFSLVSCVISLLICIRR